MKDTTIQTNSSAQDAIHFDTEGVAKRLLCSEAHARRLIGSGRLPALNIGTSKARARWRVTLADLEAFEKSCRISPK